MREVADRPLPHFEPDRIIDTVVLMGHMGRDSVCERVEDWERDLSRWSPDLNVVVLPTRAGGIDPNTELILDNQHLFGRGTIQAEITGDGGANHLINASQKAALIHPHIGEVVHLFGDGGTMGDTARSFNSRRHLRKPSRVLECGRLCTMNLMEIVVNSSGQEEQFSAMGYVGPGDFSTKVSELINGDGYRKSPWLRHPVTKKLRQMATVLEAKSKAEPITIAENGGEPQNLCDVLYIAGPRMAGFHTRVKQLTEPGYHRAEIHNTRWPYLLGRMGKLLTNTLVSGEPSTQETYIELKSDARLQYDGETRPLKAGDSVTIRPGGQIQVVTTRKNLA